MAVFWNTIFIKTFNVISLLHSNGTPRLYFWSPWDYVNHFFEDVFISWEISAYNHSQLEPLLETMHYSPEYLSVIWKNQAKRSWRLRDSSWCVILDQKGIGNKTEWRENWTGNQETCFLLCPQPAWASYLASLCFKQGVKLVIPLTFTGLFKGQMR